MADLRKQITNEKIAKEFKDTFALVNHAIDIAHEVIAAGREISPRAGIHNQAFQILDRIAKGEDWDLEPEEEEENKEELYEEE